MRLPPTAPATARIVSSLSLADLAHDNEAFTSARGKIPGWSRPFHFTFFGHVLAMLFAARPLGAPPPRILICGVYHGLDLALIQHAAALLKRDIQLVGVDLFSDQPCADWTDGQRDRGTWEANGFGPAPSIEAARQHAPGAEIVQSASTAYMISHPGEFDFVYLDTSHDYATVLDEIHGARTALKPGGILAGDDYYEPGTHWGVDRAVQQLLPHHVVFFNRIWLAQP